MSDIVNGILDVEISDNVDDIPAVVNQASSLEEARVCTGPNDKTLLDLIGQASPYPAIEFLNEVRSFSQATLNVALILACQQGFLYLVQKLVQLGADIECRDASGKTPLLICVENHYFDLVRFLVARRADVKAVDCAGNNALILSISFAGSREMKRFLLEQAGDMFNHQNNDGYTALMKALEVMDVGLLKLLLETYVCENCRQQTSNTSEGDSKWTLLDRTVSCKGETAQQIAEKHGLGAVLKHLKECISEGTSPIQAAVEACDLETLNFLCVSELEPENEINGAFFNIFSKDYDNEQNALPREILPITKILLECGADLKRLSTSYPVSIAVDAGDYDLVELLCKHGALLNQQRYRSDKDPLCLAAKNGRMDIIELLLKYNADLNTHSFHKSPLECALIHGYIDCARCLVNHGAKMDISLAISCVMKKQDPDYMKFLLQNYENETINCLLEDVKNGNTFLLAAVKGGNLEIIEQILQAGVDVNIPQQSGATPIVKSKNAAVALLLIRYGADVNHVTDVTNETPLMHVLKKFSHYRTDSDKEDVVQVLLENGASVRARTRYGTTPLMLAARLAGHEVILQTLLHQGADCSDQDNNGNTALLHAISGCCSKNAIILIQSMKNNTDLLNLQNSEGYTALMCAVSYDNGTVVSELIGAGADVNITDENGDTALHHAVKSTSQSHLKVLISGGSNINHQNNAGLSPLMLAALKCNYRTVSTLNNLGVVLKAVAYDNCTVMSELIDSGADVNITDVNGNTALHLAVASAQESHLKVLINGGCDINHQNNDGFSPLMLAVNCNNRSVSSLVNLRADMNALSDRSTIMSALIDSGADVNITDVNGDSALHLAVKSAPQSHLKVLINCSCDISHQNNDGLSPLMLAVEKCNHYSVSTLINLGADVNAVNHKDTSKTALSCVPKNHYHKSEIISCIKALLDKGANCSFLCPGVLATIITSDYQYIIPKLIQCGLGPTDVDINDIPKEVCQRVMLPSVSPLCLALLTDNVSLARYFWRIMFMTTSDLYISSNKIVRGFLQLEEYEECLSFLDEVLPQPMSLFKMCLVAVTSAVGASPGRDARVNKLPLPWVVKDMLLFKSGGESNLETEEDLETEENLDYDSFEDDYTGSEEALETTV